MDKQTVYLDTSIIIGYLKNKNDEKEHSSKTINELKGRHPNISVVIPQIVLGEAINKIIEKEGGKELVDELLSQFTKIVKDLEAETPSPIKNVLKVALDISKKDDRLEPTDALIVAQALCDPNSTRLVTTDAKLIGNKDIMECEKRMRREGERNRELQIDSEIREKKKKGKKLRK